MSADSIDTEHLAELLKDGDGAAATPQQLAQLGRAHIQLLARARKLADAAQVAVLDLEAANRALRGQRAVNAMHRQLLHDGKLREPAQDLSAEQAITMVLDAARHFGGERTIGLLAGAAVAACMLTADPDVSMRALLNAINAGLAGFHQLMAQRARGASA